MKDFSIIRNIYKHPLNRGHQLDALMRFAKWQLSSCLFPFPVIYPFVENSVLVVEKGMTGATGNIYNGLHEYADMLFLLHFLRPADIFVDVGANVGSYTVLASANCGAACIALEPVPATFRRLERNVLVNKVGDKVRLFNYASGRSEGELSFTSGLDAANHVLADGKSIDSSQIVTVKCIPLDDCVRNEPDLIKIDVEGFESEVIAGASRILASSKLKVVIIELNGLGSRYGFDDHVTHAKLLSFGFSPFSYDPFNRDLSALREWGTHNTIYVRDIEFVDARIRTAKRFKVNKLSL